MQNHFKCSISDTLYDFISSLSDSPLPGLEMTERDYAAFILFNRLPTHGFHLKPRFMPRYTGFDITFCTDSITKNHILYVPQSAPHFTTLAHYNYSLLDPARSDTIRRLFGLSAHAFITLTDLIGSPFLFKAGLEECALTRFCIENSYRDIPWLLMIPCNVSIDRDLNANLNPQGLLLRTYYDAMLEYSGTDLLVLVIRAGRSLYALHDEPNFAPAPGPRCAVNKKGKNGFVLLEFEQFVRIGTTEGWWDACI